MLSARARRGVSVLLDVFVREMGERLCESERDENFRGVKDELGNIIMDKWAVQYYFWVFRCMTVRLCGDCVRDLE